MRVGTTRHLWASDPSVYTVESVVAPDECAHIVELAAKKLQRGKVSGDDGGFESPGRSGSTAWITHDSDPAVHEVCTRLADLVGLPLVHAEALQIVHYGEDQQYKAHFDAYDMASPRGQRATANGGQRMCTALVYLSDDFDGGETAFPKLDIEVAPVLGRVVVFENCMAGSTRVHPMSLHAGMPVRSGEKWAANLWFRERPRSAPGVDSGGANQQSHASRRGIVVANRARRHLDSAVAELWPHGRLPANITYWDTFSAPLPDDARLDPDLPTLRVLPGSVTATVDDKGSFFNEIVRNGIEHVIPLTFVDRQEALRAAGPEQVWIVKPFHGSGARGLKILDNSSLAETEIAERHILQMIVDDPFLVEERRITSRAFVLTWAQRLFVFDEGRVRMCSEPWQPGSTSWNAIVGHDGIAAPHNLRVASQVLPNFSDQVVSLMSDLRPVFEPLVRASSLVDYQLGALDYTLTSDGRLFVYEFNAMPNLIQGESFDAEVNRPLLREALAVMCAGGSDRFIEV